MPRDLTGQVIVITGASSGIGAATAVACARAGMNVVLNARRGDRLERVAAEVRRAGAEAEMVIGDVTDQEAPRDFPRPLVLVRLKDATPLTGLDSPNPDLDLVPHLEDSGDLEDEGGLSGGFLQRSIRRPVQIGLGPYQCELSVRRIP